MGSGPGNFDSVLVRWLTILDSNIYIQSATVNGEAYTKNYITHSFFLEGGVLELTLGANESTTWGTGQEDVPPSLTTDNGIFG